MCINKTYCTPELKLKMLFSQKVGPEFYGEAASNNYSLSYRKRVATIKFHSRMHSSTISTFVPLKVHDSF